ncbi:MAG: hypothetical protein ACI89X_000026 [Planctomycetota bacterium]|jgi:hypothetical protein
MTRTQQTPKIVSSSSATDLLAAPFEDVLPEHVLLRLLHDRCVVAGDTQPGIEFALQFASEIAASQSLSAPIQDCASLGGSEMPLDDDVAKEAADERIDLPDLATEKGIASDIDANAQPSECSEDGTLSNELDVNAADEAVSEEAVVEVVQQEIDGISTDESASDNVSETAANDVDEQTLGTNIGDDALELDDLPAAEEATDMVDEPPESSGSDECEAQFEDAELGALMADIGGSGVVPGADEEQQELQDVFGDPDDATAQVEPTIGEEPPANPEATAEVSADTDAEPTANEVVDPAADTEPETVLDAAADVEPETVLDAADDVEPETVLDAADDVEPEALSEDAPSKEPPAEQQQDNAASNAPESVIAEPAVGTGEQVAPTDVKPIEEVAPETTAEIPAASAPANQDSSIDEELALTSNSVDKVRDFLGDLKSALVEMAHRPQQAVNVEPLVEALQAGFNRSAEQATQTSTAVASLSEHMSQFGRNIEGGVAKSIETIRQSQVGQPVPTNASEPNFVRGQSKSQTVVLGTISLVVLGWSILFWIKTGSPRLALGTLIGANAIACCLLLSRRDRS